MRKSLEQKSGQRSRYSGIFVRFGEKRFRWHVTGTVLLKDIRDEEGKPVTDHLWFNLTEGFEMAFMDVDDHISFVARVNEYWKGYEHCELDFKLSYPTKIENDGQITHSDYYSVHNGEGQETVVPDLTATVNPHAQEESEIATASYDMGQIGADVAQQTFSVLPN